MKKLIGMLAIVMALCIPACLPPPPVDVDISVPLPPPVVFSGPPEVIVLPDTDVYVVPDYDVDIYFYAGWWWRPWGGRWYRSLNYDSGWKFYNGVPGWYGGVYPHWRENYRNHMWEGHRWDYRPVHYNDVRTNWKSWQGSGYWRNQQKRGTIGSYHQRVETRRDFRGFGQETRSHQAPVATHQGPVVTHQGPAVTKGPKPPEITSKGPVEMKSRQAPVISRQTPDLSKNKSPFAGVGRGSDARIQSNRGLQSRQSMSPKGKGGVSKGNVGRGGVSKDKVGGPR